MALEWSLERYIRVYIRDTAAWLIADWEEQAFLLLLMRKLDMAGNLDLGADGTDALVAVLRMPEDKVEKAMRFWMSPKRMTLVMSGTVLHMPNFFSAQNAKTDVRARVAKHREMEELKSNGSLRGVTNSNATLPTVTRGNAVKQTVTPSQPSVPSVPSKPPHPSEPLPALPVGGDASPVGALSVAESSAEQKNSNLAKTPHIFQVMDNFAKFSIHEWCRVFAESAAEVMGYPISCTPDTIKAFKSILQTHCPATQRSSFELWLKNITKEFTRAFKESPHALRRGLTPFGLEAWLNDGRKSLSGHPGASNGHGSALGPNVRNRDGSYKQMGDADRIIDMFYKKGDQDVMP